MADAYVFEGSRPDFWVYSPSNAQDVQVGLGRTIPSGVYFEVPIPADAWASHPLDARAALMQPLAVGIEHFLAETYVTGAAWSQDFDANGLLADFIVFQITIPPPSTLIGPFKGQAEVPMNLLRTPGLTGWAQVQAIIDAAIYKLEVGSGLPVTVKTPTSGGLTADTTATLDTTTAPTV